MESHLTIANKRIMVRKSALFFAFIIFPHFEFYGVLMHFPVLSRIYRIWRVASACYCLPFCIAWFIQKRYLKEFHIVPLMYLLLVISFSVSTIVNGQSVYELGRQYYASILLMPYFDIMMKKHAGELIDALYFSFCFVILINFLTVIRGGIIAYYRTVPYNARIYFIGSKNKSIVFICMAMVIILLHKEMHGGFSLLGFTSFVLCIITPFLTRSAQGIVGTNVILASYVLMRVTKKMQNIITYRNVLIVIGVLFFFVFSERLAWATGFLENVLHRDMTLTGRTMIWGMSLRLIQMKPILGYGFQNDLMHIIDSMGKEAAICTHCDYLQFILYGGVILFSIFILTLIVLLKCKKSSNHHINIIIYTGIFCFLLNMIVDNLVNWFPVYLMFCLMENMVYISKACKKDTFHESNAKYQ